VLLIQIAPEGIVRRHIRPARPESEIHLPKAA
jgi:hypothetical protein